MPSKPSLQAWRKMVSPSPSICSFHRRPGPVLINRDRSVALRTSLAPAAAKKEPRHRRGSGLPIEYPAPEARWRSEYSKRRTPAKRHPAAKRGHRAGCVNSGGAVRFSAFWFVALFANISKLFRSFDCARGQAVDVGARPQQPDTPRHLRL
jgi:hypothetical protein